MYKTDIFQLFSFIFNTFDDPNICHYVNNYYNIFIVNVFCMILLLTNPAWKLCIHLGNTVIKKIENCLYK